jgi:hypothetical protein
MLGRLYLTLYFLPMLALVAASLPAVVEIQNAKAECAHEMIRNPTTSKCTL